MHGLSQRFNCWRWKTPLDPCGRANREPHGLLKAQDRPSWKMDEGTPPVHNCADLLCILREAVAHPLQSTWPKSAFNAMNTV